MHQAGNDDTAEQAKKPVRTEKQTRDRHLPPLRGGQPGRPHRDPTVRSNVPWSAATARGARPLWSGAAAARSGLREERATVDMSSTSVGAMSGSTPHGRSVSGSAMYGPVPD